MTNIIFSNKRKMINKNIKKILNKEQMKKLLDLKMDIRPANIKPEIFIKLQVLLRQMVNFCVYGHNNVFYLFKANF